MRGKRSRGQGVPRPMIGSAATLTLIWAILASPLPGLAADSNTPPAPYLVVLRPDADAPAAARRAQQHGARVGHRYEHAVRGYAAELRPDQLQAVRRDPQVAFVEPDRTVRVAAQGLPTGVDRIEAERAPAADIDRDGSAGVQADIAIVDTGIDRDHPDLNVVGGHTCVPGTTSWQDFHGHGTHVAGIAAARDNGIGVVGVAPGARLWSVRVFDANGYSRLSWIVCGIDWLTGLRDADGDPRIEVVNMSLRDAGRDDGACGAVAGDGEHAAICRSVARGITFVVAAGNDRTPASRWIPAAYPEVIAVSALADYDGVGGGSASPTCSVLGGGGPDDRLASFSNYGTAVDLMAPGVCIHSTANGGGYRLYSGTSMAAPHVAGAAALYAATHPGASPATIRGALRAGGSLDWITGSDRDATHEPLLDVWGLGRPDGGLGRTADKTIPTAAAPRLRMVAGSSVWSDGRVPLRLTWSGSDALSGIAHFDLRRSVDGSSYALVRRPTPDARGFTDHRPYGHRYRYRTTAWDRAGNRSLNADGPESSLVAVQSGASSIAYRGGWSLVTSNEALGSGTRRTTNGGATARFSFTGREVAWVGPRSTSGGRARVSIDGTAVATVDLRASSSQPRRILFDRTVPAGNHVLTIEALSGRIEVDAFLLIR